jgi:hypothetical protein
VKIGSIALQAIAQAVFVAEADEQRLGKRSFPAPMPRIEEAT